MRQINMICEVCGELLSIVDVEVNDFTDTRAIIVELECDCGFKKEIPILLANLYFSTEPRRNT